MPLKKTSTVVIGVIAHPLYRLSKFNNSVAKRLPTPNSTGLGCK